MHCQLHKTTEEVEGQLLHRVGIGELLVVLLDPFKIKWVYFKKSQKVP
jgi:hypothetical protein